MAENTFLPPYKTYNGQTWTILVSLRNIKRGLLISLVTDRINLMILYNSIECFSPTFELTYSDFAGVLNKVLDDNDLMMRVIMHQPSPNPEDTYWDREGLLDLELLFDVEKVSTVFKNLNNTMYRFNASLHNKTFLLKNANYATSKDLKDTSNRKESPLAIINKLLSEVDYPNDYLYNDTNKRINFISSQSMNVKDSIDYLLRQAVTEEDPPTYFVHNIKSGKAMLINNKYYENRLDNPTNRFYVSAKADSKVFNPDLLNLVSDLKNNSFNTGVMALRYLGKFNFRYFNQNTRKWDTVTYDFKKIDNMFNKNFLLTSTKVENYGIVQLSDLYESILPLKQKVELSEILHDFPTYNEDKMYLYLRELQLGMNTISFNIGGNITRDAGQYVTLMCTNEAQIPRYEGLWHIFGCRHVWSGHYYTNELVCYRTMHHKPVGATVKLIAESDKE